jgi:hypothetical protein
MLSVEAFIASVCARPRLPDEAEAALRSDDDNGPSLADYSLVFALLAVVGFTALTGPGIALVAWLNQAVNAF